MMFVRMVVAVFVGAVVSVSGVFAEPEVFSDNGFAFDRATAMGEQKIHVLYFTASWCPPCKKMKTTTWVDESVVSWLDENAIVTAIDVDEQKDLAQRFRIRSMPTFVVTRELEEIARSSGYMGPVEFGDWLKRAEPGELLLTFEIPEPGEPVDLEFLQDQAEALLSSSRFGGATDAYEWLWEHMLEYDPEAKIERAVFMARSLKQLCDSHEQARLRFAAIRDREQKRLEAGDVEWPLLADWVVLNGIIGDDDATIAWLERNTIERDNAASVSRISMFYERMLVDRKRLDLLAKTVSPLQKAWQSMGIMEMGLQTLDKYMDSFDDDFRNEQVAKFAEDAVFYYSVAAMQGDENAASQIAERLLTIEDSDFMRTLLIDAATEAGVEPIGLP